MKILKVKICVPITVVDLDYIEDIVIKYMGN